VLAGKLLHHRSTREDNARAQEMLNRAIELDARYAHAHAWRACVLGQCWVHEWCEDRDAIWAEVVAELDTALGLDDNDSDVHRILAAVNLVGGDFDQMMYHQERAISLNPNDDLIVVQQGEILSWLGRAQEGIEWIEKAMRLNPYHPERYWNHLGRAHFVARNYEKAAESFRRITKPDHTHHAFLAACYARLPDMTAAEAHVREVLNRSPDFRIESYRETLHYRYEEDFEHHIESLRKAGLPD
jgi:adenylate cyclase